MHGAQHPGTVPPGLRAPASSVQAHARAAKRRHRVRPQATAHSNGNPYSSDRSVIHSPQFRQTHLPRAVHYSISGMIRGNLPGPKAQDQSVWMILYLPALHVFILQKSHCLAICIGYLLLVCSEKDQSAISLSVTRSLSCDKKKACTNRLYIITFAWTKNFLEVMSGTEKPISY
jgi:hypothetical protein